MAPEYSVDLCNKLTTRFRAADLHRPQRIARYDAGTELAYEITAVSGASKAQVRLVVEKFVGGGFAGQVYRVRVLQLTPEEAILGIVVGGSYAMKILIPPSGFSRLFRNAPLPFHSPAMIASARATLGQTGFDLREPGEPGAVLSDPPDSPPCCRS